MNRNDRQERTILGSFITRSDENNPIIEGKFITFTGEYQMPWGDVERISPELEIEGDDVRALINHDTSLVLGRTTANTLTLDRRDDGVYGIINVNPKDQDAMNLYARVERGDVSQCSFGFEILDEETEFLDDDTIRWTVKKIRLHEVSVCTFPAYEDTEVSARKKDADEIRNKRAEAWKEKMTRKLKGAE